MSTANSGNDERDREHIEEEFSIEDFQVVDECEGEDAPIRSPMNSDGITFSNEKFYIRCLRDYLMRRRIYLICVGVKNSRIFQ